MVGAPTICVWVVSTGPAVALEYLPDKNPLFSAPRHHSRAWAIGINSLSEARSSRECSTP
jgi:hypothetical protein